MRNCRSAGAIVGSIAIVFAAVTGQAQSNRVPVPGVSGPLPVTAQSYPFAAADHQMSPFDLAKGGVKVIAAGDDVPITTYARKLVQNLAVQPAAPGGFDLAYEANVVSREDNVQAVVAKVELGEGDAAIVYATDAAASGKVDSVRITPETANVTATYAGVVVVRTLPQQAYATEFLHWLAGPDGAAILEGFGFLPGP